MPSTALTSWRNDRLGRLDELLAAHQAVGGIGPGRRWRTRELNWALVLRLAGEFQGFARDLHDLAADFFASAGSGGNSGLADVLTKHATKNRQLDRGNAQPGSLGADFDLIGLSLWSALGQADRRSSAWNESLTRLNQARNAIAHVDEPSLQALRSDGYPVRLAVIRTWRRDLDRLAGTMDDVASAHLSQLLGRGRPW